MTNGNTWIHLTHTGGTSDAGDVITFYLRTTDYWEADVTISLMPLQVYHLLSTPVSRDGTG